ncbi:protein Wnt-6 isoform X2 [Anas acuta]|uniref:protein Wnt-6 isoform X2 n=1 Tax=Anas acuta TaxID=28680 RepID=UPI0035C8F989
MPGSAKGPPGPYRWAGGGGGHGEAGPCQARRRGWASSGRCPVAGGCPEPCPEPCPWPWLRAQGAALGIPESPRPARPVRPPGLRFPCRRQMLSQPCPSSSFCGAASAPRSSRPEVPARPSPAQPGPARPGTARPLRPRAGGGRQRAPSRGAPASPSALLGGARRGARLSSLPPSPWQDVAPLPDPAGALLHPPLPRQHHRALVWGAPWSWTPTASAARRSGWRGSRRSCASWSRRSCRRWPRAPSWACGSASTNSASAAGTAPATASTSARSCSRISERQPSCMPSRRPASATPSRRPAAWASCCSAAAS